MPRCWRRPRPGDRTSWRVKSMVRLRLPGDARRARQRAGPCSQLSAGGSRSNARSLPHA